jgi:hypothetical protein
MNLCVFCPDRNEDNETCGNIATRQVWLHSKKWDLYRKGYYVWVCEQCMPEALAWWKDCEMKVEF